MGKRLWPQATARGLGMGFDDIELVISQGGVASERLGLPTSHVRLFWLGQAGFLIESEAGRILLDPYLSDSLAIKYRGTKFPHMRMMPPPVKPECLKNIDVYFVTHGHTDHLDPGTIGSVARGNPECCFIVPAACSDLAVSRGVPRDCLIQADAFTPIQIGDIKIYPIPSAHETLIIDDAGHHLYLGYIISIHGLTFYHSGDCVPYPGLVKNLVSHHIDVGLLPINGRDAVRTANGIAGNFSLEEAVDLASTAGFRKVIGHHYGMFDFNTVDPEKARVRLAELHSDNFFIAQFETIYDFCLRDDGSNGEEDHHEGELFNQIRQIGIIPVIKLAKAEDAMPLGKPLVERASDR